MSLDMEFCSRTAGKRVYAHVVPSSYPAACKCPMVLRLEAFTATKGDELPYRCAQHTVSTSCSQKYKLTSPREMKMQCGAVPQSGGVSSAARVALGSQRRHTAGIYDVLDTNAMSQSLMSAASWEVGATHQRRQRCQPPAEALAAGLLGRAEAPVTRRDTGAAQAATRACHRAAQAQRLDLVRADAWGRHVFDVLQ